MPPTRTIPPAKAVKMERTHEENQERAYIAASRRSDRSLEARVESARRASEIHKRRTGRSLRVTEKDVINEEMYEEEDDDLPAHYRRIATHFRTGSADFNTKLSAYLTNQLAMRSAVHYGITNAYGQNFPNASQYPPNQQFMYPSPMLDHQQQQVMMMPQFMQSPTNQSMQPPTSQSMQPHISQSMQPPTSPSIYRQTSYQSPRTQQGFQPVQHQQQHQRSASIATPQELSGSHGMSSSMVVSNAERRVSMPSSPIVPVSTSSARQSHPSFPQGNCTQQFQPYPQTNQQPMVDQFFMPPPRDMTTFSNNFSPFTTTLPAESQMFFQPMFYGTNQWSPMPMDQNDYFPQQYYNDLPQTSTDGKTQQRQLANVGLETTLTLAPAAPDALPETQAFDEDQNFFDQDINTNESSGGVLSEDNDMWTDFFDESQYEPLSASQ